MRRMWRPRDELKRHYDVVIVGGGSHGLATAYYLAKHHGITNVADPREELHRLRRRRAEHDDHPRELPHARGRRVLQGERQALREALAPTSTSTSCSRSTGHLTLAHSDRSLIVQTERAEVNQLLGIDSRVVDARRGRASSAPRSTSPTTSPGRSSARCTTRRGGIIRHDAVVWGFAKRRRPAGRRDPPGHRGDRDRPGERPRDRRADEPRRHRLRHRDLRARPAGRRSSATWPACRCRSRRTSSRRS